MGIGNRVTFEVRDSLTQQVRVVLEPADSSIAVGAQKCADAPGGVAVIDGQMDCSATAFTARREFADGTDPVLGFQDAVVVGQSDAVFSDRSLAIPFFFAEFVLKYFFHIWEWRKIVDKLAGHVMFTRMLFARVKVNMHGSIAELLSAITARPEFPSSRPEADPPSNAIEFRIIRIQPSISARLAFPFDAIGASGVLVEFVSWLESLTSRAKFFVGANGWNIFANSAPMAAQLGRKGTCSAKSASNCCFA